MKRYLFLTLVLILFSFTVGCSKKNTVTAPATNTAPPTTITGSQTQNTANSISQPKQVTLDKESWKKLNIFFSNFSEVDVPPFEKGKLADDELILFGIRHTARNNSNLVGQSGIDKNNVEQSVRKYFGKNIEKHQTVCAGEIGNQELLLCKYNQGYYEIPNAQSQIDPIPFPLGEHDQFSQINKLFDNGNGTFTAYVNVYESAGEDAHFVSDPYSTSPEEWIKNKNNESDAIPTLCKKMKATIKKESDGRYILIDYLQDK